MVRGLGSSGRHHKRLWCSKPEVRQRILFPWGTVRDSSVKSTAQEVTLRAPGMMAPIFQAQRDSSSLHKLCFLSAIVITGNFLIGIFARMTGDTGDEVTFFDTLWRVVVGQRVGIDFHYALGIGPYQLGALLWHWLGPHYYVMLLSITFFNLSIAFCGCIVAERTLARRTNLALLFCVTLAFQVSAPTVCNSSLTHWGIGEFYNRLINSALAVLFLQTFAGGLTSSKREHASEVAVAACLLNIMFLTKISGFLLGVMILSAGCLLQGRIIHRLLSLCATLLAFAAITAIEFKMTGLELLPIIQDYELAAHARLNYSLDEIERAMVPWPLVTFRCTSGAFCTVTSPRRSCASSSGA